MTSLILLSRSVPLRQTPKAQGYLYTNDSYKTAKWQVEISGLESDVVRVRVNPNLSGYLFFGSYIISFLLRVKMNQKGYPFIHGSGISRNDAACIFPARSGSGKTVTTMHYLDNGYKLLGDNFVIVNREKVLSFPSSMNIFYYNLAPKIKNSLSKNTLFVLKLKHLLYKLTLGYIKIFTPVSVKKLFPGQIVDSSSLKMVGLMQVGPEFSIEKMSKDMLVQHLLYNNQMDAHPFIDYITEYAFVYPDSWLSRHWDVLADNYKNMLDQVEACYKITLPRFIDDRVLKELGCLLDSAE
ncbi:MAG: hypothetical protein ACYSWP_07950 [Planctomycetota bacterium]